MVNLIRNKKFKTVSTFHNVYNGSSLIKKTYNKGLAKMDYIVANSDFVKDPFYYIILNTANDYSSSFYLEAN